MSKLKEQWEKYISTVPGLSDAIDPPALPVEDSDVEYSSFVSSLPADVGSEMGREASAGQEEPDWGRTIEHHWCLCEMPEGDFPRVFAFPSLQRLTEAIAKREGQETAVWPMYGIPLRLTKPANNPKQPVSATRYLLLPNQLAAVVSSVEPYQLVDQIILPESLETQDEGWLGDPQMLKDQSYFLPGVIEDDDFSADPDLDGEDDEDGDQSYP